MSPASDESPGPAAGSRRVAAALFAQQARLSAVRSVLGQARPADIHQARVTARRLRSLLKTYRRALDRRAARLYRLDLKSFARALGPLRQADVRLALLREEARGAGLPGTTRRCLDGLLRRDREAARRDFSKRAHDPEWQALSVALDRAPQGEALLADRRLQIGDALNLVARPWRRVRGLLRKRVRKPAELHELRLRLKHCRYALESVGDLAPKDSARLLRRLRRAQDAIGMHRDVLEAMDWVQRHSVEVGEEASETLHVALEAHAKSLRKEGLAHAERIMPAYARWLAALEKSPEAGGGSGTGPGNSVKPGKPPDQSRSR